MQSNAVLACTIVTWKEMKIRYQIDSAAEPREEASVWSLVFSVTLKRHRDTVRSYLRFLFPNRIKRHQLNSTIKQIIFLPYFVLVILSTIIHLNFVHVSVQLYVSARPPEVEKPNPVADL